MNLGTWLSGKVAQGVLLSLLVASVLLSVPATEAQASGIVTDAGVLLADFENVGDWTIGGVGASQEADTTYFKEGTQSLKLNSVNGAVAYTTRVISENLSSAANFVWWFYVSDLSKLNYVGIYISSSTTFAKFYYLNLYSSQFSPGWNHVVVSRSSLYNSGGESWDNTMVRLRVRNAAVAGQDVSVSWDDFRHSYTAGTRVILAFDDEYIGQYDKAYPIMAANNQKGTLFLSTSRVGLAGRMTLANIQTLHLAGWDVSNHTLNHIDLTTANATTLESEVSGGYDWLVANGFGGTAGMFAYPYGLYNDAVVAEVSEKHYMARATVLGSFQAHLIPDGASEYYLKTLVSGNITDTNTTKATIDAVILQNGLLILTFHDIVDSDADNLEEYLTAKFQIISDYLAAKQALGLLVVETLSQYYREVGTSPSVATLPFGNIILGGDGVSVLLSGSLSSLGSTPIGSCWVEYGATSALGSATSLQELSVPSVFSDTLTVGKSQPKAYYRAVASNAAGTTYGATLSINFPSTVGNFLLRSLLRVILAGVILVGVVRAGSEGGPVLLLAALVGIIAFVVVDGFITLLIS